MSKYDEYGHPWRIRVGPRLPSSKHGKPRLTCPFKKLQFAQNEPIHPVNFYNLTEDSKHLFVGAWWQVLVSPVKILSSSVERLFS